MPGSHGGRSPAPALHALGVTGGLPAGGALGEGRRKEQGRGLSGWPREGGLLPGHTRRSRGVFGSKRDFLLMASMHVWTQDTPTTATLGSCFEDLCG